VASKFLEAISNTFQTPLPEANDLDKYLEEMLLHLENYSENLDEEDLYLEHPWLEFRDDDYFHESILHFFNPEEEYLNSVNGEVSFGYWRKMNQAKKLLIENGEGKLYELAFLDANFFILKKHGDNSPLGKSKYLFLVKEEVSKKLEWRDAIELLHRSYRNGNGNLSYVIFIILAILVLIILFI
jgi:hypothetical protein